ncbi:DUF4869 domain-containing protein [Laedolimicola sp.]|uniref:DUF4869 domain-containing protein n=1 Tax=Laedolimicola sp. TaxID=2981663 RepID=UPI003F7F063A
MLSIFLGDMDGVIYHPPTYFDNRYEDEWITEPLSVAMIKDVDKSEVVSARLIDSPVLEPISTKELSGGVKTLMLMAFDESGKVFNASACGDNCAKWILKIAQEKDLTINLRHIMDFGEKSFEARILNTDTIVHNMSEFIYIAGDYV